jgi:hypothetical protein
MIPFAECKTALAVGFSAHLIFDVLSYVAVAAFGVKIGCWFHRHKHAEPESTDTICDGCEDHPPARAFGSPPFTITGCDAMCGRSEVKYFQEFKDGGRFWYCSRCAEEIESMTGIQLTRFVEL